MLDASAPVLEKGVEDAAAGAGAGVAILTVVTVVMMIVTTMS